MADTNGVRLESLTYFDMARVSAERAEEQTRSDEEKSVLEEDAARYSGAWFRSQGRTPDNLQGKVNQALEKLGYDRKTIEDEGKFAALAKKSDSKTEALVRWVKQNLFANGTLRDDERLIVFTEYKETLFYLEQRFLHEGFDKNTLRLLYGGMMENISYDHGKRYDLHLAVAMPDHVHLLLQPREKEAGRWFDLAEILKGIKGVSSRRINQLLGTTGTVWQAENFDRIMRNEEEYLQKWEYIWNNPVKAGLVSQPEQYPFFVFPEERTGKSACPEDVRR
ncbi:MAG TPA: transposase [Gemmataceae bacterium]|jgi:REP element-mobilizing transposase RayT